MKKAIVQILLLSAFFILVTESGSARSGALQWAKKVDGTLNDFGSGIATDGSGNILLTGYFRGTMTLGAGEANKTDLSSSHVPIAIFCFPLKVSKMNCRKTGHLFASYGIKRQTKSGSSYVSANHWLPGSGSS